MVFCSVVDDKEDEEAEYAWLPYTSIKPFNLGDISGNDTGIAPADPVLLASVAAAENMLRSKQLQQQQAKADYDDGSDSDGGWGISREQQLPPPPPPVRNLRGRGRNHRARGKRGGRGRGGRGGRGRRGVTPEDDENSDSEGWAGEGLVGTAAAAAAGVAGAPGVHKSTIESILAWRMPLSEEEKDREQVGSTLMSLLIRVSCVLSQSLCVVLTVLCSFKTSIDVCCLGEKIAIEYYSFRISLK